MNREIISMNKDWKFQKGEFPIMNGTTHEDTYRFSKAGGKAGAASIRYNDSQWTEVTLPHDWVVEEPYEETQVANHGYKKRGIAWYRKTFQLDQSKKGKHIYLEFGGICGEATIFFNGSVVERNFSNYNTFIVDISDYVCFGEALNTIAIKVDATHWEGWWYEGAGIYQDVKLMITSPLHVAHLGTWVNPIKLDDTTWNTKIETTVENTSYEEKQLTIRTTILNKQGEQLYKDMVNAECKANGSVVVPQEIKVEDIQLWDIDTPNLYTLKTELLENTEVVDEYTTTYGYRTIRFCSETGFYLNDKPVKLKGTCNHLDHAGLGVAVPKSMKEYRIRRLKEMGSNAYRSAHNTAYDYLDVCDEMGMLVMEENRNFECSKIVERELTTTIRHARNHPCVILYSIFNEEVVLQATPQGKNIAKRMMATVKKLDPTRPILGALNGGYMEEQGAMDCMDVVGFNYATYLYDEFHEKFPSKIMVGSENASAFSVRGEYVSDPSKHTINSYDEESAPWGTSARDNWKAVNTRDFVAGSFTWTGFDYQGEPTPFIWPSVSTFFGIMDNCGFAKDVYYLYQAMWKKEPVLHILPHWNWEGKEGQPIKVMTHTNCEEVELFLNDNSLGKKKIDLYEQGTWEVPYEPGALCMVGYCGNKEVARAVVETVGKPVALRVEPDRDYLLTDEVDAMPITIVAIDEEGRVVPYASHKVSFSISGGANLLGTGNGNPNSHESFKGKERDLFHGMCQCIIQSNGQQENSTLTVSAPGMESVTITIQARYGEKQPCMSSVKTSLITDWITTQSLYDEKPDPTVVIDDFDMNTWEGVDIVNGLQKRFDHKVSKYAMYRAYFETPNNKVENGQGKPLHIIRFGEICGEIEVYVNQEQVYKGAMQNPRALEVTIQAELVEKNEITVVIKSIGEKAGIGKAVQII